MQSSHLLTALSFFGFLFCKKSCSTVLRTPLFVTVLPSQHCIRAYGAAAFLQHKDAQILVLCCYTSWFFFFSFGSAYNVHLMHVHKQSASACTNDGTVHGQHTD